MKTIKRLIAVILLILLVLAGGYLVFTGNRLCFSDTNYLDTVGNRYVTDNVLLQIEDETKAYYLVGEHVLTLTFVEEQNGVLSFTADGSTYKFVVLSADAVWDPSTKKLLMRRDR